MQAISRVPRQSKLLIQRAGGGIAGGGIARPRPIVATLTVPDDHLPLLPATWRPVPGAGVATVAQRFAAYTGDRGVEVHLHSVIGLDTATTDRLVALVGLGRHRVSVFAGGDRVEARWQAGETMHRLTVRPTTLGTFMELVLNLTWP